MDIESILTEIESRHMFANQSLRNKDLPSYMSIFSSDLEYQQPDKKIIGKKQILRDTQRYFGRIRGIANSYERLEFVYQDGIVTERLIQKSSVGLRIFIFFTKNWQLEREGIYHWRKNNGIWEICKVEILSESVM